MESGFFSKMFGGKKETNISTADAIQKLRETENLLIRKQEYLEKKIEDELAKAKKNATKNKKGKPKLRKYSIIIVNHGSICICFEFQLFSSTISSCSSGIIK